MKRNNLKIFALVAVLSIFVSTASIAFTPLGSSPWLADEEEGEEYIGAIIPSNYLIGNTSSDSVEYGFELFVGYKENESLEELKVFELKDAEDIGSVIGGKFRISYDGQKHVLEETINDSFEEVIESEMDEVIDDLFKNIEVEFKSASLTIEDNTYGIGCTDEEDFMWIMPNESYPSFFNKVRVKGTVLDEDALESIIENFSAFTEDFIDPSLVTEVSEDLEMNYTGLLTNFIFVSDFQYLGDRNVVGDVVDTITPRDIDIDVHKSSSAEGIKALGNGSCDAAMTTRKVTQEEEDLYPDCDFNSYLIARDAVSLIVDERVYEEGVSDLDKEEIHDIYTDEIDNWKYLGGPNEPIHTIGRTESCDAQSTFQQFIGEGSTSADNHVKEGEKVIDEVKDVSGNEYSIGYVSTGYLDDDIRSLSVHGVKPDKTAINTEQYPMTRELYVYTDGEPMGLEKELIDILLSREGQDVVEQEGFINVTEGNYNGLEKSVSGRLSVKGSMVTDKVVNKLSDRLLENNPENENVSDGFLTSGTSWVQDTGRRSNTGIAVVASKDNTWSDNEFWFVFYDQGRFRGFPGICEMNVSRMHYETLFREVSFLDEDDFDLGIDMNVEVNLGILKRMETTDYEETTLPEMWSLLEDNDQYSQVKNVETTTYSAVLDLQTASNVLSDLFGMDSDVTEDIGDLTSDKNPAIALMLDGTAPSEYEENDESIWDYTGFAIIPHYREGDSHFNYLDIEGVLYDPVTYFELDSCDHNVPLIIADGYHESNEVNTEVQFSSASVVVGRDTYGVGFTDETNYLWTAQGEALPTVLNDVTARGVIMPTDVIVAMLEEVTGNIFEGFGLSDLETYSDNYSVNIYGPETKFLFVSDIEHEPDRVIEGDVLDTITPEDLDPLTSNYTTEGTQWLQNMADRSDTGLAILTEEDSSIEHNKIWFLLYDVRRYDHFPGKCQMKVSVSHLPTLLARNINLDDDSFDFGMDIDFEVNLGIIVGARGRRYQRESVHDLWSLIEDDHHHSQLKNVEVNSYCFVVDLDTVTDFVGDMLNISDGTARKLETMTTLKNPAFVFMLDSDTPEQIDDENVWHYTGIGIIPDYEKEQAGFRYLRLRGVLHDPVQYLNLSSYMDNIPLLLVDSYRESDHNNAVEEFTSCSLVFDEDTYGMGWSNDDHYLWMAQNESYPTVFNDVRAEGVLFPTNLLVSLAQNVSEQVFGVIDSDKTENISSEYGIETNYTKILFVDHLDYIGNTEVQGDVIDTITPEDMHDLASEFRTPGIDWMKDMVEELGIGLAIFSEKDNSISDTDLWFILYDSEEYEDFEGICNLSVSVSSLTYLIENVTDLGDDAFDFDLNISFSVNIGILTELENDDYMQSSVTGLWDRLDQPHTYMQVDSVSAKAYSLVVDLDSVIDGLVDIFEMDRGTASTIDSITTFKNPAFAFLFDERSGEMFNGSGTAFWKYGAIGIIPDYGVGESNTRVLRVEGVLYDPVKYFDEDADEWNVPLVVVDSYHEAEKDIQDVSVKEVVQEDLDMNEIGNFGWAHVQIDAVTTGLSLQKLIELIPTGDPTTGLIQKIICDFPLKIGVYDGMQMEAINQSYHVPIVYPTIGEAPTHFSLNITRVEGIYVSFNGTMLDRVKDHLVDNIMQQLAAINEELEDILPSYIEEKLYEYVDLIFDSIHVAPGFLFAYSMEDIDNEPAELEFMSPQQDEEVEPQDFNITFSTTDSPDVVAWVTLNVTKFSDSGDITVNNIPIPVFRDGIWSTGDTWWWGYVQDYIIEPYGTGDYEVTIKAHDFQGYSYSIIREFQIVDDAPDPIPPESHVDPLPEYNRNMSFDVSATASDDEGVDAVSLYYRHNGGEWKHYDTDDWGFNGWDWSFNTYYRGDGEYQFYTRAIDDSGNYEEIPNGSDEVTKVDYYAPETEATGPENVNGFSFDLSYEVQDKTYSSGLESVTLYYTRNGGWTWEEYGEDTDCSSPMTVTVNEEGTYGWQFVAEDRAGNIESFAGGVEQETEVEASEETILEEDFEGSSDWSTSGLWHKVEESDQYGDSNSQTHSMWYGQDSTGNYDTGSQTTGALSKTVDLSGATQAELIFHHWYETESYDDGSYDRLKVTVDGQEVYYRDSSYDNVGSENDYVKEGIDISDHTGQEVEIRFVFDSLDGYNNGYRGWYIDDVKVTADSSGGDNSAPSAGFSFAPTDPTTGETVQFTETSEDADGTIASYSWDFGDGSSSTEASPSHTFSLSGTYTIGLTVTDNDGAEDSTSEEITVQSDNDGDTTTQLDEDFEDGASDWSTSGLWHLVSESDEYGDSSSQTHSMWYGQDSTGDYDTGSRTTGQLTSPSIDLTQASQAELTFQHWFDTENYDGGNYDKVKVTVNGDQVYYRDTSDDNVGSENNFVNETIDLSSYVGQTIQLKFIFDSVDKYTNDYRGWYVDDIRVNTESGENSAPTADFDYSPDQPEKGQTVQFTSTSSDEDGTIASYSWDFGDGSVSDEQDPTYSYSSTGTYDVSLTVTDEDGDSDSITKTIVISSEEEGMDTVFKEDFEGSYDWSTSGLWHPVSESDEYGDSNSQTHSMWYGQDSTGDYDTGSHTTGQLTSPSIDLTQASQAELTFQHWFETENHDGGYDKVKVLVNGEQVYYKDTSDENVGSENEFVKETIDLSSFVGQTIQVTFEFDSIDDYENGYRGWYVDDVEVKAESSDEGQEIYSQSFETSEGWSSSGLWHPVSEEDQYGDSKSGSNSMWYGQDSTGNYDTGSRTTGDLTLNSVDLTGVDNAELSFAHWFETENHEGEYDLCKVKVNGEQVYYKDASDENVGSEGNFVTENIDISDYAGQTVDIEFTFDSVDDYDNAYQGWYIDDVAITSEQ